jgi:hypothetical protein
LSLNGWFQLCFPKSWLTGKKCFSNA